MEFRQTVKKLFEKHTLTCIAGGFLLGLIVCGAGSWMMTFSGSPLFCGTCHAMKGEAATFAVSSHSNLECTDCHLPHDNMAVYLFEKGRTGMADTYHEVLRDYPAHIIISDDGRQIVDKNCLRCHENTMSDVHMAAGIELDTGGDCVKCHRGIAHGKNHLEGGIKVE